MDTVSSLTKYFLGEEVKINIQTQTHSDSGANLGSRCLGTPAYSSFSFSVCLTLCHVLFTHSV